MLRNCSVYLWISVKSLLMMGAGKVLVWFLSRNHRLKLWRGLRRSLTKPPAQSRASSGVSPDCSCLGQVGAWSSSGTDVAQTLRVICVLPQCPHGEIACLSILFASYLISLFLDPKKYPWKKYLRKITLQCKPVKILWLVPIRTW